jgi:hypothetical protein
MWIVAELSYGKWNSKRFVTKPSDDARRRVE